MQYLSSGSELQHGKYRIERVLGQGGFGITYLAENTMLEGKVAIKEFFFKEYCERGETTSCVTVPTSANREIVDRFKQKFIKEARTIFRLSHPNIVRILDVFEENDTAYYVMEHIDGESLGDLVKRRGALPEQEALDYICQAADALAYIHAERINHLDVKPGNLVKRAKDGRVLLIDFGVAKQYDAYTSEGSTTTPVGVSHGYSPSEQYRKNGVHAFSPASDIYSLAATLFKLLTSKTPPEAMEVIDDGLPLDGLHEERISEKTISAIVQAMKGRNDRTQSIDEFIINLGITDKLEPIHSYSEESSDSEKTKVLHDYEKKSLHDSNTHAPAGIKRINTRWKWIVYVFIAIVLIIGVILSILYLPQKDVNIPPVKEASFENNVITVKGVTYEMIPVEGGTFIMGKTVEQEGFSTSNETSKHGVKLDSFLIGKTEVTQALWEAVMGSNPSYFKGNNKPVENISWNDCQEFIRKLNNLTGMQFRLPTEAEWEYSARGGRFSVGHIYSGDNNYDQVCWCYHNSGGSTQDVATRFPNELGLYDMSGNVSEWCSDWGCYSYSSEFQVNPKGPDSGSYHMVRGGSWYNNYSDCRVSWRYYYSDTRCNTVGLRLVLSEQQESTKNNGQENTSGIAP